MLRCTRCEGFIPAAVTACPNCSKFVPRGRAGSGFLAVLGAGAAAITLMACYGMPPCDTQATDGGSGSGRCAIVPEQDAGVPEDGGTSDGGVKSDAGTCDAGGADGGC
ncbi:MAG: hypothetical protein H6Q89_1591 [Myxococcaceae bacterium]|nr:hypothetical protein [Myxococcaceae bacterium]